MNKVSFYWKIFSFNSRLMDNRREWGICLQKRRWRGRCWDCSARSRLDPDGRWTYECIFARQSPKFSPFCRTMTTRIVCRPRRMTLKEPSSSGQKAFGRHQNAQRRRASCDDRRTQWAAFVSRARSRDCEQTVRDLQASARLFPLARRICWWFHRVRHSQCICRRGCKQDSVWTSHSADRGPALIFHSQRCTSKSFRRWIQKWQICCQVRKRRSTNRLVRVRSDSGAFRLRHSTSRGLSRGSCLQYLKYFLCFNSINLEIEKTTYIFHSATHRLTQYRENDQWDCECA